MSRRLQPRKCANRGCGRLFQPKCGTQRYCSQYCYHKFMTLTLPLDDMIADWHRGLTLDDIVEKYGFSRNTIISHMQRARRQFPIHRHRVRTVISGKATTYLGNPCPKGHNGLRFVCNHSCVQCNRERMVRNRRRAREAKAAQ